MRIPNIVHAESIGTASTPAGGKWTPARPLPYPSWRMRWYAAWMVFIGKADAIVWRDQ